MDRATRQWRFEIRVFLLLDELPSKANESHLPGTYVITQLISDPKELYMRKYTYLHTHFTKKTLQNC